MKQSNYFFPKTDSLRPGERFCLFANSKEQQITNYMWVRVAPERHVNTLLLAAISICNLSLKNGLEAFAMACCLSHSNKHSRPDHVRILWLNYDAAETDVLIWQAPENDLVEKKSTLISVRS
jgi:hypothetical protein